LNKKLRDGQLSLMEPNEDHQDGWVISFLLQSYVVDRGGMAFGMLLVVIYSL
jgi:hypothetical protein